jgi:hypothetical protein
MKNWMVFEVVEMSFTTILMRKKLLQRILYLYPFCFHPTYNIKHFNSEHINWELEAGALSLGKPYMCIMMEFLISKQNRKIL